MASKGKNDKDSDVVHITAGKARADLSQLMEQVHFRGKRYVLERYSRPMAVLIGYDEYEKLTGKKSKQ